MKNFIKKIINIIKDRRNAPVMALGTLILIASLIMIGIMKTVILIVLLSIFIIVMKYGGILVSKMKKKNHKKTSKKKLWSIISLWMLIIGIGILIMGAGFIGYIVVSAPKFDPQNLYRREASILYDSDGKIITKIGREIRDKITYDEMPQVFIDAIIATEDSRFLQHNGFDLPRFLKATLGQLSGNSGAGGASTITMQVAKNNFTSTKQTITRKFTDIYLSIFEIEKHYTKEQILEFYVNAPYLGNNSYGVAEASRNYFGKELQDINLSEAALLAGIFNAPSAYDPTLHPDNASKRRGTVLYLMRKHGYISAEEAEIANDIPVSSLLKQNNSSTTSVYQGYIDTVINEVIKRTENNPYDVPMKIYTNFKKDKQDYLNRVLSGELFNYENPVVQVGVAVVDVNTGGIIAIGNGRNRTGERLFNFGTEIKRQTGSTAKPIFDYGPAMEYNNWSTYTPILDDSYTYSNNKPINDFDGKYLGLLTTRIALEESRNIPALKVFQQLNNKNILDFVLSLGMTPEIDGGRIHEAHSIGGYNGASPLQMAAAYAAFANGGYYIEPYTVNKIEYIDINKTETYSPTKTRVMSDSTAYMITDILREGVDTGAIGGGKTAGVQVAAKSGTSNFDEETKKKYKMPGNAINDLWYAGYSPDYAIGMWYGYEKISAEYVSRFGPSSIARNKLFTAIAKGIFDNNGKKFSAPKSVVEVSVEKDTIPAMLPSIYTPAEMITTELFKRGTEPTEVSPRFDKLASPTGLDADQDGDKFNLSWNKVTPVDTVTEEYRKTIEDHLQKYLDIRAQKDASLLGVLGYNVYLKKADNSLTLLGFTTNNSYTHKPSDTGNVTYVIKTCYSIFKANESSGSEITITNNPITIPDIYLIDDNNTDDTNSTSDYITNNISIGDTSYDIDNNSQRGIVVLDNLVNVTNDAIKDITVTNTDTNTSTTVHSVSEIIINTSIGGHYQIKYEITYNGTKKTLTRDINIQ